MSVTVRTIESPGLGDRSYLVHDGATAFVVDPPRDVDRVLSAAEGDGVGIASIFETHVHNDYDVAVYPTHGFGSFCSAQAGADRDRATIAGRHLVGSLNFEADGLPTYVGWLMPWGSRLTLLAGEPDTIAEAQRRLSRIGIDRPNQSRSDQALAELPTEGYPVVEFARLAGTHPTDRRFSVVDVRRRGEYDDGHLDGAINIPLHELLDHLHHVPDGPLWVHCASGARASIAASLLARADFDVTLVNGGPDDNRL